MTIEELEELRFEYEKETEFDKSKTHDILSDFYSRSRGFFKIHVDNNDKDYIKYTEIQIGINGYTAHTVYTTEIKPIYMALLEQVKYNMNMDDNKNRNFDKNKVFIVHGHDNIKESVARFLENQGIEPIILSEQPNIGSSTIIEKLERNSNVGYAIIIYAASDVGKEKNSNGELLPRVRQNVLIEQGYFMGKLGRERVIVIKPDDVEVPSDISGVLYLSETNWKLELAKEMKAVGYNIDNNKIK